MNPRTHFGLVVLALSMAAAAPAMAATQSHEHGDPATHAKLSLDHGKRWATDEPLRKGMGEVRSALAASLPRIKQGKLDAAQARSLGETLEKQVGYIVENCKLSPEADANLHIVVADLVSAADALKEPSPKAAKEGAHRAVKAANLYGRYFDHPGWKPL